MDKKNSYDDWWLPSDMENMGYFFEFCNNYTKEYFDTYVDAEKFTTAFMKSNCRHEMETGHPKLLSQAAVDTLRNYVEVDLNSDLSEFTVEEPVGYRVDQMYWVGWMYAYIHFEYDIPSAELVNRLPVKEMLRLYGLGHEMSKELFLDKVKEALV